MPNSIKWINKLKGLPESFCLDNYASTESLDAGGWAQVLKRRKHLEAYNNWYGLGASVTWAQINNDATTLSERTKNHCKRTEKIYNDLFANPLNQQATMPFPIGAMELDEPPLRHLTLYDLHLLTHTLGFTP